MTEKEYLEKKSQLEAYYSKKIKELKIEFALSNNLYRVGDIISDRQDVIRIQETRVVSGLGVPECVFFGPLLTKKLVPWRNKKEGVIYQKNVKRIYKNGSWEDACQN